jgi:hypothetical protein
LLSAALLLLLLLSLQAGGLLAHLHPTAVVYVRL